MASLQIRYRRTLAAAVARGAAMVAGTCILLGSFVVGCATSHRIVHHRGAYFEHCHSADYDLQRSSQDRIACWTAWLQHYSEGAAPERVAHAAGRVLELQAGKSPEPFPGTQTGSAAFMTFTALPVEPEETVESGETAANRVESLGQELLGQEALDASITQRPDAIGGPTSADPTEAVSSSVATESSQPAAVAAAVDHPHDGYQDEGSGAAPCMPVCGPMRLDCLEACEGYGSACRRACTVEHRICLRGCQ